jgi:hypothetical protein
VGRRNQLMVPDHDDSGEAWHFGDLQRKDGMIYQIYFIKYIARIL